MLLNWIFPENKAQNYGRNRHSELAFELAVEHNPKYLHKDSDGCM